MAYRSTSPGQPVGKVGGRTYGDTSNILSSLYGGAQFYYLPGDRVDASFSRSSDAAFRDDGKTLVTAGSGVIRDKHYVRDENGFLVRAIKLEAARTNELTRSEEFDHGDWPTFDSAVVTADDAVAPDGTTTADKVADDDGTKVEEVHQADTVPDDSLNRCISVYVRKSSNPVVALRLLFLGGTGVTYTVTLDPGTGTVEEMVGSASTTAFGVEDVNSDWWRLWVSGANNGAGNTTVRFQLHCAWDSAGDTGTSGDASVTGSNHFWGAQLEGVSGGASFPSSYIATTDSAVSRAADDLSFPISFGPQEATLYGKLALNQIGALGVLAHIGDETDGWRVEVDASNNLVAKQFTGGSTASSSVALSHSFGDIVEWRAVFTSDGDVTIHASVNGGAETSGSTDTSLDLPSSFGSSNIQTGAEQDGTNTSFGDHIVALLIAPGVRTTSEMRGLV